MKEIKFRGKSFENGWVYGYYKEVEAEGNIFCYIFWQGHSTPIIKESVGQFIGLTDFEGNEIYEKDILESYYSRDKSGKDLVQTKEVVEYNLNQWDGKAGYELLFLERAKVIGNIIDNPELLEG